MARPICSVIAVSLLAAACAGVTPPNTVPRAPERVAAHEKPAAAPHAHAVEAEDVVLEDEAPSETAAAVQPAQRRPGDVYVQRFSGGYRKTPVVLEEKVIAWEEDVLVTDYTLEEGKTRTTLRVRTRPADSGALLSVARLRGSEEIPATAADLDALLEKTAFAADTNDGLIDAGEQTCMVGGRELSCKKIVYRVSIGDTEATMTVLSSDEVPGRDVAGEIVGSDGKLLYRTELVEAQSGAPASTTASTK